MNVKKGIYSQILSRSFSGTKFFLIGAIVLIASCKKESDLGSDIQPSGDLIDLQASDSLTLKTYTVREDSLRSDEPAIIQIGELTDPYFGKTTASLFTQFVIPNGLTNLDFSGSTLDSCSLNLAYDFDYYGDTTSQQTFNVYQMTEDIYHDSLYHSNKISQCYPTFSSRASIGNTTLAPHPRAKTIVGSDTLRPQLRIPIQYNFANQIFTTSPGNIANTEAFVQFIKGFYIESQTISGNGALMRFNLRDTTTKLTFYYHTATDTLKFSFVINASAAYYSHFTHDFSGISQGDLLNQLNNPGVNTSNEVYVSACAGVKTKIEFPYLNNLRNLGYSIAINKAELVIKADPSTATAELPINKQLYVVSIDSLGNQMLLTDMFENSVYYGGSVNTTTSEYHINIARYFQQLLSGTQPNNGLYLKEIDPDSQGRRAVLGSSNSNSGTNNYRMYLHLVYTRIN
ncbi:MAG TPA: DUF4270 family protein [Bacteroidia bacterium]|nr:DUF4270 family protein [Bacteroidia bacterium]